MILDFDRLEPTVLPRFQGGDKQLDARMFVDEHNKILRGRLEPGASIGLHTHETSSETIYILRGTGRVLYDGAEETVRAGVCHYCPRGHAHSLINDGDEDLEFFAVVPQQGPSPIR